MTIDLQELRGFISDMYSDVARFPRGDFHFPIGRPIMERLGYPSDMLDRIPKTALESFAGVGYHFGLHPLEAGEQVLDIGCGSGSDVLFAALSVGEGGHVTGLDMTDAMIEKSTRNVEKAGVSNVTIRKGHAENLPFDDGSFDCVVSNGVINLTPDKAAVMAGIARVLKPGGRLMFSDIATGLELPDSVRENCELWAECIGGAVEHQRYLRVIEQAGFRVETALENDTYAFTQDSTLNAAKKFMVRSLRILAYRQ